LRKDEESSEWYATCVYVDAWVMKRKEDGEEEEEGGGE